ncbi:hypothetical protein H632_c731p1 [Helicosporidium sp. ATCC 50920]|nr:hypothetical protein H632_c731p1 [Helicosporidium sp. ATCC 50920]|eukprot:KDD75345.1 hypothetical protein H632_c731p1 [Helicosporidium sp. ATCC 50920]
MPHTDFWGEALVWGDKNSQPSQEACCKACRTYTPNAENEFSTCNVWVFCGDRALCGDSYGQCWLKHLAHPLASKAASEGPEVGWTTGVFHAAGSAVDPPPDPTEDRSFHTVITAQGSAVHWQSRVGYYWFLKTRKACRAAGKCEMGGFTRVLHSGEADDLMEEIPTYVAQPLPKEHPNHGYVVLNRPYALMQWARDVTLPEKYVLMSEPDHVWLKPMPNLMSGHHPAAFPFFYIEPSTKKNMPLVAKYVGAITKQEAEQIAPIGNAPTMMHWDDLQRAMPVWFNVSIAVHEDEETAKEWGWVQEMYAFTLSLYKVGIKRVDLFLEMMAQPPWDTELAPPYILHYTYGMDYTLEGEFTPGKYGAWRFDKRSYAALPPPRNLGEPPAGMKNELVRHLIHAINEASAAIPGWDQYAKTGKAEQLWDGKV